MNTSDFADIAFWGLIAGCFAFLVLNHNLAHPNRAKVIRWCLAVGFGAILYFAYFALVQSKPFPSRTTLGLGFVGIPALICGLLLVARDNVRRYLTKRKGAA